jgi:predicted lipid-binding transport protein (Tim44 family)/DNA-directed RNA polymerase subunit RPC12/RpoP
VLTVKSSRRPLRHLLPFLGFFALSAAAFARAGGGESYSGGGGSGGGGGDGGGLIYLVIRLLIWLIFHHPVIGIPLTIVIVYAFIQYQKRTGVSASQRWDSAPSRAAPAPRAARDLDDLRALDPEFSVVLFEDFAYALFARAHQARSSERDLEALSPYLSPAARADLAQRPPAGAPVSGVVIGAMRVAGLSIPPAAGAVPGAPGSPPLRAVVTLEFEANMTVGPAEGTTGAERTHYVKEVWRLERDANVQSKPPERALSFQCPNCGAPFGPEGGGRCQYCGEVVSGGRFDWSVESIGLVRLEERPPALTSNVREAGTDFPTIFHPQLNARWAELVREDPGVTQEGLNARLQLLYGELNGGWSRRDLTGVRPFVSDGLFDYLQYWTAAYEKQGLRNVLEGMRITDWKTVKIVRDRHYDSLTVRLWGSGRDTTVREATGEVVSGNPHRDRLYSEYWTLIRGAGVKGTPRADKSCPNCGAPLDVNMAGQCEHCGAKITSGEFDWVLSKIEQDDSYTG